MKKWAILAAGAALLLAAVPVFAAKPTSCTRIQDGVLTYSAGHYFEGEPLMTGYDPYGYNYQAHMFSGSYANSYLGKDGFPPYEGDDEVYLAENPDAENAWYWPYRDVELMMKWNDAWLSNSDCDGDGLLDRYYGFDSYVGSGAWLTNHQWGEGWNYFVKIVAAPSDAYVDGSSWYTAGGKEIGSVIWGSFARILQVSNDPAYDEHGVLNNWEAPTGFGFYKP